MKKKWPIVLIIIIVLIITAVIILPRILGVGISMSPLDLASAEVEEGTLTSQVVGTGNIKQKMVDVNIPYDLTIDKVMVEKGDYVTSGDVLATVTSYSISSAIDKTRRNISDLQDEIDSIVKKDSESVYVDSNVEARVKVINAAKGDSAATVVNEKGALIVLSLDGKMGVKIDNTDLSVGDKVTVTGETTGKAKGTIEAINADGCTVTLTDEKGKVDEEVTVTKDDTTLGTGKLYVNKPLKITNSVGSVKSISVKNNDKVWSGTTLLTLSKTTANSNYESLSKKHEEQSNLLEKLNDLAATREIRATESGTIDTTSVSEDSEFTKAASDSSAQGTSASNADPAQSNDPEAMPGEDTPSDNSSNTTTSLKKNNYEGSAFKIASDNTFSLSVKIDELDVASVNAGLDAIIEFDAIEGESFEGRVYDISSTADVSHGVAKYSATIDITKSPKMIDGMSASANIIKEKKDAILILPVEAVQEDGDKVFVYTQEDKDGVLSGEKDIVTGLSDGTSVEIISGLSSGDVVYYQKAQYVNEAMEMAIGL